MKYLSVIVICLFTMNCYASHIAGGEITYTYVSSRVENGVNLHTYNIVFKWYTPETCLAGSDVSLANVMNIGRPVGSTPPIVIEATDFWEFIKIENINNLSEVFDLRNVLHLESVVGLPLNCACNGIGSIAGTAQYTYSGNVELPERLWRIKAKDLKRTNIPATNGIPPFYVETILNSTIAPHNNSVQFANVGVVNPLVNQPFSYNHGATDPDGNLLEYEFINPLTAPMTNQFPVSNVSYASGGYSINNIFGNGSTYNNTLGNGSFSGTSVIAQRTVLALRVVEKNAAGEVVGSVIRDMEINVIVGTNANPDLSTIFENGINTNSQQINANVNSQLCFTLKSSDNDLNQHVTLTSNDITSVLPSASFVVTNNNTLNPEVTICWTPTAADVGKTFCFTVVAADDACGLDNVPNGVTIKSYCITVPPPPPVCPPNTTCETIIEICQDIHISSPCTCSTGDKLWYQFNVTNPSQQINISGSVFNNGNISNLGFQYAIIKPSIQNYECNTDLQNDIIASGNSTNFNYTFNSSNAGVGTYILVIDPSCDGNLTYELDISFSPQLNCTPCEDCIGSFRPIPDQKYIISAWVKEEGALLTKTSYDKPIIQMHFYTADHTELPQIAEFKASGMIIDGWQRIEEEFFVPAPTHYIAIELLADGVDAYFDDIRVFPFDASMKSYVYDPVNMRLVAELDERHYATFYEYDEEGKLIRIKKETEKGVMTIQETRNSTKKQ